MPRTAAATSSSTSEQQSKKRSRKAVNCEPCRLHKLKCNRARPCSGCVLRGTQHLCYADDAENTSKRMATDPFVELGHIQRSVAAMQVHYRALRNNRRASPSPEPPLSQDLLLEATDSDGFYVGPTFASTSILNYLRPAEPKSPTTARESSIPPFHTTQHPLKSRDLVLLLPNKETLAALVGLYQTSATWIFSYIEEIELKEKLRRYIDMDEIDELTLALFFAISAVVLYYTPWPHKILRAFPEPAMATGDHFHHLCIEVIDRSLDECMRRPSLEFLELNLLVGHYYASAKHGDSGERIWELCHRMMSLATALGLHRDPYRWNLTEDEMSRRRWAWWNVLTFERWHCLLLGRPNSVSNSDFDTRFPMPDMVPKDQPAAANINLPFLNCFRFTVILGDILEDLHSVRPVSLERIAMHDRVLVDWQDSWPPDLKLDEFGIAAALSRNADEEARRRGVQSMYLIGLFNLVRLLLNRPTSVPSSSNSDMAWTHDKVAGAAAKLISLHVRAVPDYINNSLLTVPGHLSNAPYNLFTACMFYTYQLLANPDQPGAAHFRANLSEGISTFGKVREMPIADRCFKILVSVHPPPTVEGEDNVTARRDRIAIMRRVSFPYVRLADISDIENIFFDSDSSLIVPKTEPDCNATFQDSPAAYVDRAASSQPVRIPSYEEPMQGSHPPSTRVTTSPPAEMYSRSPGYNVIGNGPQFHG